MDKLLGSSQFRLSLIYISVFGSSVLVLLGFLYWSTAGYMARQTEATIDAEIQGLAEQYRQRGLAGLSSLLSERMRYNTASVYLLTDSNGRRLLGNLGRWPDAIAEQDDWLTFKLPISADAGPDIHVARARQFTLRGGFRLLVGRDVQELRAVEKLLARALGWGLAVTCLLGIAGAVTMSRSVVRRIDSINHTARSIMAGDLSRRVPTSSSDDDFDELASNLNAMLDRIQRLMEELRRVSDNIAHDLRTPLSRLRNKLEELSDSTHLDESERRTAQTAISDADALLATFNALLRIARIESGHRRENFRLVDVTKIAGDVAEFYEPLADEQNLRLDTDIGTRCPVSGDGDLLFQAFANLVDNAIKYTPAHGVVKLTVRSEGEHAIVEVSDTGPGVSKHYHHKILQRFYRLDAARSTPGNGLGLSLVAAVAQLHGAELTLAGESDGLRVRLKFLSAKEVPGSAKPEPQSSSVDANAVHQLSGFASL